MQPSHIALTRLQEEEKLLKKAIRNKKLPENITANPKLE
jgi:hypothetical protein